MSTTHFLLQCTCGAVIAQCRCPAPDKRVEVRPHGCRRCQAVEAERLRAQAPHVWRTYEHRT